MHDAKSTNTINPSSAAIVNDPAANVFRANTELSEWTGKVRRSVFDEVYADDGALGDDELKAVGGEFMRVWALQEFENDKGHGVTTYAEGLAAQDAADAYNPELKTLLAKIRRMHATTEAGRRVVALAYMYCQGGPDLNALDEDKSVTDEGFLSMLARGLLIVPVGSSTI